MSHNNLNNMILRISILLVSIFIIGNAQTSTFELGGYAKYLLIGSKPEIQPITFSHLVHTRLNSAWYPSEALRAHCEIRFRAYLGNIVSQNTNFNEQIKNRNGIKDLDVLLWNKSASVGYAEIDRLYAVWNTQRSILSIGRQRITWGTSLVWNAIDIFNPRSILDIDYEELPAVDALQFQFFPSEHSGVSAVYRPKTENSEGTIAAKLTINKWEYDFHFIAGNIGQRLVGGLAWAGDIAGAGFRGEVLISQKTDLITNKPTSASTASAVISFDYTFSNSLYLHTEALYQSEGVKDSAKLFLSQAAKLGLLSPARLSVFQEISGLLSPLVRASLFGIINPYDGSYVVVPSFHLSITDNFDLSFYGLFFKGRDISEYGGYGKAIYIRTTLSF